MYIEIDKNNLIDLSFSNFTNVVIYKLTFYPIKTLESEHSFWIPKNLYSMVCIPDDKALECKNLSHWR